MYIVSIDTVTHKDPKAAVSLIDEMTSIRALKPQITYIHFIDSLFQFISSSPDLDHLIILIIIDVYFEASKKAGSRDVRGLSEAIVNDGCQSEYVARNGVERIFRK